ncbi:M28 family metallopeptidase [Clostridium sp. SYSU_GA19001]|uniref:M28 family metallopeptidase n=1 Tax=Clostridium caldaquaticum TaxID=2940653 RepID=UPI00207724A0|nr:M28 family metallopeptidase [Clostridium caldaquaticum]MCM8709756.1 M28 family metallopeptidase [Clostridium caldaquaticum]
MKKTISAFFLTISLLLFTNSINIYKNIYKFNHTSVKNNIDYLTSDDYKGRLAGTLENIQTEAFVKNQFQQNGLEPFNGDYYDPFDSNYPHKLDENPYLRILDKNSTSIIKEYEYGSDYKEEMLSFKKNHVVFSNKDSIKTGDNGIQITKGSDSFLFFVPESNSLTFRSSFLASQTSYQSMYVMLTEATLKEIKEYLSKDYKISCFIPFEVKNTTLNNVVGFIKGKDTKTPPVVISAHFDHLGTDLKGNIYRGALDNASGISFILELSKYITSLGTPDRNIIFVGFNAEEFGLLGSEHFVKKYSSMLKGAKVYNFDMIGSSAVPLSIMGGKGDTKETSFMRSITSTINTKAVNYKLIFEDASDHEPFRRNNIDAVTFCDSDMSRIHTPEDTIDHISVEAIDRAFNVISKEIIKQSFNGNPMLIYYKNIMIFSALGTVLFSFLLSIQIKKN